MVWRNAHKSNGCGTPVNLSVEHKSLTHLMAVEKLSSLGVEYISCGCGMHLMTPTMVGSH
jgi:hypothetical protein